MTGNISAGSHLLGSLRSADGRGVVRVEERYDTDIDDLWSAITDPARLTRWYGRLAGDLRPGGQFQLHILDAGMDIAGRIETCEPPRRLVVTHRETDESHQEGHGASPFDEIIDARLTADGEQTILVIEVRGMPLELIAYYGAGWQIHAENLAGHLAGRDYADTKSRWAELVPPYQELAAAIG